MADMGDRFVDQSRNAITNANLQNPLFIHPSDNSGMVLTTIQLTGDNYRHWSKAVRKALSVKNKLGFIEVL